MGLPTEDFYDVTLACNDDHDDHDDHDTHDDQDDHDDHDDEGGAKNGCMILLAVGVYRLNPDTHLEISPTKRCSSAKWQ